MVIVGQPTERNNMEYKKETEYRVMGIMKYHTKDDCDTEFDCYCKSISEVVDLVYFYLNKFDRDQLKEIKIIPETKTFYKKGSV